MNIRKKILYVDDEEINLQIFKITFGKDFDILVAGSGEEGLKILSEHEKDITVVFSDLRMPVMDGLEFVSQAKAIYPHIRFNLLTGYELTREIQEAINSGLLNKYFSKPFKKAEVLLEFEKP